MLFKTSVHLWVLVSLIIRAGCTWNTVVSGDTLRFSVDVVNNYFYFEKVGDASMYYGVSVTSVLTIEYGCNFDAYGELDYDLNPASLGISTSGTGLTISGNNVISNQEDWTNSYTSTVGTLKIYSFHAKYLPASGSRICAGFYNPYRICTTNTVSFTSESYSSCGTCDCACVSTCFGPKPTQCNSCSAGYYLQPSSTTCLSTCPNGYYQDSTAHSCPACAIGCAICSGGSNTQCSSCSSGYYLQPSSTTCSNSCPNGYYPDSTAHSCPTCATVCTTCTGSSNTQCSSCSSGYYLQPSSTTCLNSCPNGYYQDSTAHSCPACAIGCAICSGGSNTQCSSCSSGYYLQPSSTTCSNSCPNGYYQDSTAHSCPACATGCAICSGGSNTQCSSCSSGYYLQPSSTTCLNSCPNGYYQDSTAHSCPACAIGCAICSGGSNTQCSSCSSGYYLQPSSTTCSNSCPNGYYPDSTAHSCPTCATVCTTCTGSSNTQCSSCSSGYYLQPSSTTCLNSCPNGYYQDSTAHSCPACATGCAICSGGSNTQCSSCSSGYYLQPSSTTCSNSCPNGYYQDSTTHTCPTCAIGCAICSGGSNTQCSSCSSGYYLQPSSTTCSNSCPNGYYQDSTTHTCPTCATGCAICSGGSNTQCSSCSSGYYLQPSSTTCSNSCPNGYYPDSTAHSCPACATGCAICSGGSNTQCSSCSSGYYLQPSSTTCSNSCPNGYYPDSTAHSCPTCATGCAICSGGSNTECSSCSSGYYLQPSSTTCSNSCPGIGYFPDSTTHTCPSCATGCTICTGGSNTQCSSCSFGYYLQPSSNTCLGTCPSNGYYPDSTTHSCPPCATGCIFCSGSSNTQCSNCSSGYYLQPSSTTCLSTCPSNGYYPDSTTHSCNQCNATCTLCDNPTSCTSCQPNFNLTNGTCEVCQSGYYRNQNSCLSCSLPCTECSQSATNCTVCQSPFTTNNGECSGCSTGFFLSNSSGNFCTFVCPVGFALDQSLSSCLPAANNTFVNNAQSIANTLSGAMDVTSGIISVSSSAAGGFSSTLMVCLVATEAIVNMQYLNIQHSKTALTYYQKLSQALIPNWISKFNPNDPNSTIFTWGSFERYSVSSLYLDNYGDTLTENSIYWFICLLTLLPTLCMRRKSKIGAVVFKFYLIAFNLAVSNILGQIQSQIIYFILQLKDNFFFDVYTRLSLIIGYLTMILTIGAILYWFLQLRMIYKLKREAHGAFLDYTKRFRSEKYQALWFDFKNDSRIRFYFTFWMILFNTIYILLIFSTQDFPITQCSLIIGWTVLFVVISMVIRPFNNFSVAFAHYFNFGCIVLVEVLNLYLAIMQSQNPNFTGAESQGKAIVITIIINTSGNMLMALTGGMRNIYLHFMKLKRGKKEIQNIIEKKRKLERLPGYNLKSKEDRQTSELEMFRRTQQNSIKESSYYSDDGARNSLIILQEKEGQQLNYIVEPPKLTSRRKGRKPIVEKKALGENVADIKLSSRARAKTNPIQTKREFERETKPIVQGFMIDLKNELENRKIKRRVTFKTVEQRKIESNSNAPINKWAINSTSQRVEKMNLARRRQTEFQLNEPKPTALNLDGHAQNEVKIITRRRTQTQTNQFKKLDWNLDTHMNGNITEAESLQIREQSNPPTHSKVILETQIRDNGNSQRAEIQKTQSKLTLANLGDQFKEEKKQTAERRKTEVQLNQPKISVFDAKIHIEDNFKIAERRKTQGQLTQLKINFAMDIGTQKKETAEPFIGDSRRPEPLHKLSQFANPNQNMFIKYEGRRRTRALQPGYLMQ